MESMNKFKVLTIVVICLFLFVIGAIYSNTKDATVDKQQTKIQEANKEIRTELQTENMEINQNTQTVETLTTEINNLNTRVDELSQRVNESRNGLNCRIIGAMADNGIEELTQEAAIQEARVNNRELVITCSF